MTDQEATQLVEMAACPDYGKVAADMDDLDRQEQQRERLQTPREQYAGFLAAYTDEELRANRPQPGTAPRRLEQWRAEMFTRGLTDGRKNI